MSDKPWEAMLLDWSPRGFDGAEIGPDDVMELLGAITDEAAARAYWRLDGVVCRNGITFGAALPVARMILAMLPSCLPPARRWSLELLGQIVAGEPDAASPEVVRECLGEVRLSFWYLLHGLQFDCVEMAWLYVDLIGILGEEDADLRGRAKRYLELALTRDLPGNDADLVRNTISALA